MRLCVMEGDGIGHEVVPIAVRILQHVLPDLKVEVAQAGWQTFQEQGSPLPDESLALARDCGAVIFGAATSPAYPVDGYYSPIVKLRQKLNTYANLRPARYMPVTTAREGVDLMVVRENTEDVYAGEETLINGENASATKIVTRLATERIAHRAYQLARETGRKRVTIVHKGNVLPKSDGLFRRTAFDIGRLYPDITTDELLVDTAAFWMVKEPERFDVILTLNLYGDILSDMAAAWVGGLGMTPALNLGDGVAIAEPVHGSAPDIAGWGVANPTAIILSSAMLVRYHWNLPDVATRIENAVHKTIADGGYTLDIGDEGALTTANFVERIESNL